MYPTLRKFFSLSRARHLPKRVRGPDAGTRACGLRRRANTTVGDTTASAVQYLAYAVVMKCMLMPVSNKRGELLANALKMVS